MIFTYLYLKSYHKKLIPLLFCNAIFVKNRLTQDLFSVSAIVLLLFHDIQ